MRSRFTAEPHNGKEALKSTAACIVVPLRPAVGNRSRHANPPSLPQSTRNLTYGLPGLMPSVSFSSLTSVSSFSVRNVKTAIVTATSKLPSPTETPTAPVAQRLAAVAVPCTEFPA